MVRVSPGSMHDTGCLGLVHWDDPEGWYREGGGRRVQDGEHMYTCGGFIFSPLLFTSLLFTAICKASPDSHFAFLHFFSMGMVLIPVSYTMS